MIKPQFNFGYKITSAFLLKGRWIWKTYYAKNGNIHSAIITKAKELNAEVWDFGNARVVEVNNGYERICT